MRRPVLVALVVAAAAVTVSSQSPPRAGDAALGTHPYDDYERPQACATCHVDIARQHEQAMMSQAYTHHWDEIEYFELAVPHAEKEPKVAGVKAGCNGCHAPLAFLAGDIPPQAARRRTPAPTSRCPATSATRSPASRATCPYNFNWVSEPGKVKQGPRAGVGQPAPRDRARTRSCARPSSAAPATTRRTPGVCASSRPTWSGRRGRTARAGSSARTATCRRRPGAARAWARSCPTCASTSSTAPTTRASSPASVEVRIHPESREAEPGDTVKLTAVVVNAKAGHKIPTGSAEERVLWLHVEATGREGPELPPAGGPQGVQGRGVHHRLGDGDGLPGHRRHQGHRRASRASSATATYARWPGDRIFRLPYLDPQGADDHRPVEHRRLRHRLPAGAARPRSPRPSPGSCRRTCRRAR